MWTNFKRLHAKCCSLHSILAYITCLGSFPQSQWFVWAGSHASFPPTFVGVRQTTVRNYSVELLPVVGGCVSYFIATKRLPKTLHNLSTILNIRNILLTRTLSHDKLTTARPERNQSKSSDESQTRGKQRANSTLVKGNPKRKPWCQQGGQHFESLVTALITATLVLVIVNIKKESIRLTLYMEFCEVG